MKSLTLLAAVLCIELVSQAASAQVTSPFAVTSCNPDAVLFNDVRVPEAVLANGKPLPAGTYQVKVTTERPAPAVGQSATAECWIEFVAGGSVVGREVASVVSAEDAAAVMKEAAPKPHAARVDLLKGGDYLRVWLNGATTHYVVNLPQASK